MRHYHRPVDSGPVPVDCHPGAVVYRPAAPGWLHQDFWVVAKEVYSAGFR